MTTETDTRKFEYVGTRYGAEPGTYTMDEFRSAVREAFGSDPELMEFQDGDGHTVYRHRATNELILRSVK